MSSTRSESESDTAARVARSLLGLVWLSKEGLPHNLDQMAESHISNTIKMIDDKRLTRKMCNGYDQKQWRAFFVEELRRREERRRNDF